MMIKIGIPIENIFANIKIFCRVFGTSEMLPVTLLYFSNVSSNAHDFKTRERFDYST